MAKKTSFELLPEFDFREKIKDLIGNRSVCSMTRKMAGEGVDDSIYRKVLRGTRNGTIEVMFRMFMGLDHNVNISIEPTRSGKPEARIYYHGNTYRLSRN